MWCSIGELREAQKAGPNSEEDYNRAHGLPMQSTVTEGQHGDAKLCSLAAGSQRSWRSCMNMMGNQT